MYIQKISFIATLNTFFLSPCFSRLANSILPVNRSQVQGSTFRVNGKKSFKPEVLAKILIFLNIANLAANF
jgi:hypothetical protein